MFAAFYIEKGNELFNAKEFQKAIEAYDHAIRVNPNIAEAYHIRGLSKAKLGQYANSIKDFDHATRINPNYHLAYHNRGGSKATLGRYTAAIEDYNHVIRINSNYHLAYCGRGAAKADLGQHTAAIEDFDHAIRINPNEPIAYNNRGNSKAKLGRHTAAIEDFDHAIRINPNFVQAYYRRGAAKAKLGRHTAAIEDYNHAIRINPNEPIAYNNRGNSKATLGRYTAAIEDFDHAIRINPNDHHPWGGKAVVYVREMNYAWARTCFIRSVFLSGINMNVFGFFRQHPTAPFLTIRLVQEQLSPGQYGRIADLIHTTFRQTSAIYSFVAHESMKREKKYTETDWRKWLGIINYYMGDPIVSFRLLSGLVEEGSQDLMVHYYSILSCLDFAEDPDPYTAKAIEIAEQVKYRQLGNKSIKAVRLIEEDVLELYYAGLIFHYDEEPDDALECLLKIQSNFLPAAYLSLLIWEQKGAQKGAQEERGKLIAPILERENRLQENRYAAGLEIHSLNFSTDSLRKPFAHYFHYYEISSAIELFTAITHEGALFEIKRPSTQPPFFELFEIHPDHLRDIRLRLAFTDLVKDWEDQLLAQKEKTGDRIPQISVEGRAVRAAYIELQEIADSDNLETVLGEQIEEFSLKPIRYKEFLDYFYFKGYLSEYQKLLLHFYIIHQQIQPGSPSKVTLSGIKDMIKKVVEEGLAVMVGVVIGSMISGLSPLVALATGMGISFAKGALGELFTSFIQSAQSQPSLTYADFKKKFESHVGAERERLGSKFESVYPIEELFQRFPDTNGD
jgi:tetratricopeptide (TPR) repeat protein